MLHKTWLEYKVLCQFQGFLGNVFLTTTSLLLLCHSIERYAAVARCRYDRLKSVFGRLLIGMFLLSGAVLSVLFIKRDPIYFAPGLFSCDIIKDEMSFVIGILTTVGPCFCCILLSIFAVWKVYIHHRIEPINMHRPTTTENMFGVRSSNNVHQPCRFSVNHLSEMTALGNLRRSTKALSILQVILATLIVTSFMLKNISRSTNAGEDEFLRISLFLTGVASLLQPSILLLMSKPMRRQVLELLFRQHRIAVASRESFRIIQPTIQPRDEPISSVQIPNFLIQEQEMNIHVHVVPNDNVIDSKRESIVSSFSCEIQMETATPRKDLNQFALRRNVENGISVRSSITSSSESVFVRIGSGWPASSPSIVLSDNRSMIKSRISLGSVTIGSTSRYGSTDSADSFCVRRQTLPPLSYNLSLVHKILPQAWVSEQCNKNSPLKRRHTLHSRSTRLGENSQSLLTPIENAGSLECSPRISTHSNSTTRRHSIRASRVASCLGKLQEFASNDSLFETVQ
ncbi:uncharacterized protein LOC134726469 [Mytilus trossulus]|uniref:uncharacterized protein LOC134726469 n=1 Tax=Mytilus trossulus TaxID=6551 RepID=UPI00300692D5